MQTICIVRECRVEARHFIRSTKAPDVTFHACTFHASGVLVKVGNVYGGHTSIETSFALTLVSDHRAIGSRAQQHELAG
jgi:hypothetical protein